MFDNLNINLFLSLSLYLIGFISGITFQSRSHINLLDLVLGPDGKLSASRLWANIALAVGVVAFIWSVYKNYVNDFIWLIFLGVYTGNKMINSIIQFRYNSSAPQDASQDKEGT